MNARSRTLSLAAALMLGVAAVSLTTGQAEAMPRHPKDAGTRCALYNYSPGEDVTFFVPGDVAAVGHGDNTTAIQCGADGNWHRLFS
jgi:hypothetical protein